jgi:hypothetical protein
MRTWVGADLLHLKEIEQSTVGMASIGGAGTFDGIVLSGIVAAYLASCSSGRRDYPATARTGQVSKSVDFSDGGPRVRIPLPPPGSHEQIEPSGELTTGRRQTYSDGRGTDGSNPIPSGGESSSRAFAREGPAVRISFPSELSHTNSIIATRRPGARSERSAKGQEHGRAGVNFGTASCFPHRRTLNGPQ